MAERLSGYEAPARPVGPVELPRVPDGPAQGAVRRTPRPTGDRQTLETVAQLPRGATNAPTPVSEDAGNGTDDLRASLVELIDVSHDAAQGWHPWNFGHAAEAIIRAGWRPPRQDPAGLAELRAKLAEDPEYDYAELPDCTACEGTGKDTNGSPFEAPLAVHFAGPAVRAEGRQRQLCMWCGHVLSDLPSRKGETSPSWPAGALVRIEDGLDSVVPYDGGELPPGCCALPDDEEPRGYGERVCRRCDVQAAFCPCTKPDVADESSAEDCGKHVPGTSSNRCLLRAGHTGDCWDEFEVPPCTCTPEWCGRLTVNCQCQHCARLGLGKGCPAQDGPDEAQETRAAADWPAEPVDSRDDEQEPDRA